VVNPELEVAGILRSLIDARRNDNKVLVDLVDEEYPGLCFNTVMTRTAAVGRLSINGFENNAELSQGLTNYRAFVKEMLLRVEQHGGNEKKT
jgi:chromosome partitioning protein